MAIKSKKEIEKIKFIQGVNRIEFDVLAGKSLDELVDSFSSLNGNIIDIRMQQGRILYEMRLRFGDNRQKFGEFIAATPILAEMKDSTITRLGQVANWFNGKSYEGIAWSAMMLLAAPSNAAVALEVYEQVLGKNIPAQHVDRMISELKRGLSNDTIIAKTPVTIDGEFTNVKKTNVEPVLSELRQASTFSSDKRVILQPPPSLSEISTNEDDDKEAEFSHDELLAKENHKEYAVRQILQMLSSWEKPDRVWVLGEALRKTREEITPTSVVKQAPASYVWKK